MNLNFKNIIIQQMTSTETEENIDFKYSNAYREFEPLFETLCNKVGIKKKIVLIISRDTTKFGHFTTYAIYDEKHHEINISANYFRRGAVELLNTFLHELVHAINFQNGIKDTSRNGYYHNKHFKKTSEKFGMYYISENEDKKHGYSNTKFTDESIRQWSEELDIITNILKNLDVAEEPKKVKIIKKKKGYQCVECDKVFDTVFIKQSILDNIQCICGGKIQKE